MCRLARPAHPRISNLNPNAARTPHDRRVRRITGGGALVYPGAGANFLGVVFLNPVETWLARDIKGLFAIGGNVLNLGGLITFTGCHFFNMGPTAVRVATCVGGDILTAAGVSIESGCTHTQVSGWRHKERPSCPFPV